MSLTIALAKLRPSPDNPRHDVGDITGLVTSIAEVGILEPLLVAPMSDGSYEVVAGARRFAAAEKAGLAEVPCTVREFTVREKAEAMLDENLQRADLSPIEEARAFARLLDPDIGYTQETLAARIGRTQSHISYRLSLLELPVGVQDQVHDGVISVTDGRELAKLAKDPDRLTRALESSTYTGISDAVSRELTDMRRNRTRAEAVELASKGSVAYVELVEGRHGTLELPEGVAWLNSGHPNLGIPTRRHEASACHAVTIDRFGERVYVCTSPSRHAEAVPEPRVSPEEQARRDAAAAMTDAARVRREFAGLLARGRVPKAEVLDFLVSELLRAADDEQCATACEFLELEVPESFETAGVLAGVLRARSDQGEGPRAAVGLALAMAGAEQETSFVYGTWEGLGSYFGLLERHGYQVTAAERARLNGKEA